MMKTLGATFLVYCLIALAAFGDIFTPLMFVTKWSDKFGLPYWRLCILTSMAVAWVLLIPLRQLPWHFKLPAALAIAMILSIGSIGLYADNVRRQRITAFGGEASIDHSFFRSIREIPREFQLYLHAAVLKDCVPYMWSYRAMEFQELPKAVAQNVLPAEWQKRCAVNLN